MSDPLAQSLPWLDLARKLLPVGRYLTAREQVRRRIREREAAEAMRRGCIRLAQTCALHGWPPDVDGLEDAQPLWCGCEWRKDVIYARDGKVQHVIRVRRRDPVTGRGLMVTFEDTGGPPSEELLEQVREAFSLPPGWRA